MAADYQPRIQPDGGACISPRQLALHKRTEFLSIVVVAPLMLWAATRTRKLSDIERVALGGFAVGALAVDALLWLRFSAAGRRVPRLKQRVR